VHDILNGEAGFHGRTDDMNLTIFLLLSRSN
jgi:hypothetical protein